MVDIVTSLCLERVHLARSVAALLEGSTLFSYCKCGVRDNCIPLPNVGREGHSFVHHILEHYDALPDITLFLNGGTGEGGGRHLDATRLASRVRSHSGAFWYADPGVVYDKPQIVVAKETSAEFLQRAASVRCGLENGVVCCKELCKAHCCHFTLPSTCSLSGYLLTENQTSCNWLGNTKENHAIHYNTTLAAASPPNFPSWLTAHWDIAFDEWDTIGWYSKAAFAASREAIRRIPRERWQRTLVALAREINAGMEGMYLERAWRVILAG